MVETNKRRRQNGGTRRPPVWTRASVVPFRFVLFRFVHRGGGDSNQIIAPKKSIRVIAWEAVKENSIYLVTVLMVFIRHAGRDGNKKIEKKKKSSPKVKSPDILGYDFSAAFGGGQNKSS